MAIPATGYFNAFLFMINSIICLSLLITHGSRFFKDTNIRRGKGASLNHQTSASSPSSPRSAASEVSKTGSTTAESGSNSRSVTATARPARGRQKDKQYVWAGYLTFYSVLFYTVCEVLTTINFTIAFNIDTCKWANIIAAEGLCFGKWCMWMLFVVRLDMIFGSSIYGYSKNFLRCVGVMVTFMTIYLCLSIVLVFIVGIDKNPNTLYDFFNTGDDIKKFPSSCDEKFEGMWSVLVGSYLLFDLIMNVFYGVLFIIPLRKVNAALSSSNQSIKMAGIARKVFILTVTLCASSVISMFFNVAGLVALWGVDLIINIICLILMTPYYNDQSWYQRLCKCCLVCCDKEEYSVKKFSVSMCVHVLRVFDLFFVFFVFCFLFCSSCLFGLFLILLQLV